MDLRSRHSLLPTASVPGRSSLTERRLICLWGSTFFARTILVSKTLLLGACLRKCSTSFFLEQDDWLGKLAGRSPEIGISVEEIELGCIVLARHHVRCLDMPFMLSR